MASPRTLAIQKPIRSRFAGTRYCEPLSAPERAEVLKLAPHQRRVLGTYRDARGVLYAYDGISQRRVTR